MLSRPAAICRCRRAPRLPLRPPARQAGRQAVSRGHGGLGSRRQQQQQQQASLAADWEISRQVGVAGCGSIPPQLVLARQLPPSLAAGEEEEEEEEEKHISGGGWDLPRTIRPPPSAHNPSPVSCTPVPPSLATSRHHPYPPPPPPLPPSTPDPLPPAPASLPTSHPSCPPHESGPAVGEAGTGAVGVHPEPSRPARPPAQIHPYIHCEENPILSPTRRFFFLLRFLSSPGIPLPGGVEPRQRRPPPPLPRKGVRHLFVAAAAFGQGRVYWETDGGEALKGPAQSIATKRSRLPLCARCPPQGPP